MNKVFLFFFALCLGIVVTNSSCKKGQTIGALKNIDSTPFPVFDTFNLPTSKYFFYAKFDGKYRVWQDSMRSKWDTITKLPGDAPWDERLSYKRNIYYNFANIEQLFWCGDDSTKSYMENNSYFVRPGDPFERLDLYFYDCVDLFDTNDVNWPMNELSVFNQGANPFTDPEYARNGVRIVYTDSLLQKWETKVGSGQLNDTYFRITDFYPRNIATDTLDTFGLYIVEGEFAGRLFYGNQEKTLLDAHFRARLIPETPF
jgi:hypothetical protein